MRPSRGIPPSAVRVSRPRRVPAGAARVVSAGYASTVGSCARGRTSRGAHPGELARRP